MKKTAFLVVMMMFFATIAKDIAVPALVLSAMALSNWIVMHGMPTRRSKEEAA